MDEPTARAAAEARGDTAVLATIDGRQSWLMVRSPIGTVDDVLAIVGGERDAHDATGNLLVDGVEYVWSDVPQPITLREMRWCVVVVSGMRRGVVVSEHGSRRAADRAAARRAMQSTLVLWLPRGSRGAEVATA